MFMATFANNDGICSVYALNEGIRMVFFFLVSLLDKSHGIYINRIIHIVNFWG